MKIVKTTVTMALVKLIDTYLDIRDFMTRFFIDGITSEEPEVKVHPLDGIYYSNKSNKIFVATYNEKDHLMKIVYDDGSSPELNGQGLQSIGDV
jgi:hypothetical protein